MSTRPDDLERAADKLLSDASAVGAGDGYVVRSDSYLRKADGQDMRIVNVTTAIPADWPQYFADLEADDCPVSADDLRKLSRKLRLGNLVVEVLDYALRGLANRDIAAIMEISTDRVRRALETFIVAARAHYAAEECAPNEGVFMTLYREPRHCPRGREKCARTGVCPYA